MPTPLKIRRLYANNFPREVELQFQQLPATFVIDQCIPNAYKEVGRTVSLCVGGTVGGQLQDLQNHAAANQGGFL